MKHDKGYDTYVVDGRYKAFKKSIPKAPKPVRRVSKKRASEARIYAQRKKVFLEEHPKCFSCGRFIYEPIRDIHHLRGRAGKLYLDERFWRTVCRYCHTAIHANPKWAINEGLLAGGGEWGVCPP